MAAEQVPKAGQIVLVGIPGDSSELTMTPIVRGEVELNTSYGSLWQNFEQEHRLMENSSVDLAVLIDTDGGLSDLTCTFGAFLNSQALSPIFILSAVSL